MANETDAQAKISQLQVLQQNIQSLSVQKQQFQMQLNEVESALSELEGAEEAYNIVGSVMVKASAENLGKNLDEKKESLTLRLKNLETQEERLRGKAEDLQKDLMSSLKQKKDEK